MSIPVALERLHDVIADTDRAPYLLTVSDDARPHSVAVSTAWHDDELELSIGNRTLANARARPLVTILWPPKDSTGYSLIVDGTVTHAEDSDSDDNLIRIRPTRAVWHRPATAPTNAACGADCVPLFRT